MLKGLDVCDLLDLRDPQSVPEYASECFAWMRKQEERSAPPTCHPRGTDIEPRHRRRLLEWLNEVHTKFRLLPETYFITAGLIDRYMEKEPLQRKNLQCTALAAMLVSTKYEEIYPPSLKNMIKVTGETTLSRA